MADGIEPRPMDGYIYGAFGSTHHANITEWEIADFIQIGRVVIIKLSFVVGTAITDSNAVLFSGLPKSIVITRFRIIPATLSNIPLLRLAIDTNGNIVNQWTAIDGVQGISVGRYEGEGVYICQ